MRNPTILIADDERTTRDIIRMRLQHDGYDVMVAADGQEALTLAHRSRPDLLVLDLMLPRVDGLDVCHILREEYELAIPIIMLTARTTEDDKLLGLEIGADDYVTKPFSPRELSARVATVLRRAGQGSAATPTAYVHGDLVVDLHRYEVRRGGLPIALTPTEFNLLATLIAEPARVFTRTQLIHHLFGYDYDGFERTVDVHIVNLRKKVEPEPSRPVYITTVYGVGYRFGCQEEGPFDASHE